VNGINFNPDSVGKVVLDSVKANFNNRVGGAGIALISPDIELKDVDASHNARGGGILITPGAIGEIKVVLEGTTLLRGNRGPGFWFSADDVNPLSGKVEVEGDLYIYENGRSGFQMAPDTDVNVDVKKGGSFYACGNGEGVRNGADVINNGGGEFGKKRFTCGTERVVLGSGGGNLPGCTSDQCSADECED